MQQTVRYSTFETNSSSYHTLTIQQIKPDTQRKQIEKDKDLIINTNINYKTIGYTESYSYVGRSTYEKAQLVLRFMGYSLEEQLEELVDKKEYTNANGSWDYERRDDLLKNKFYNTPLIQGFVKAIKRYIGDDKSVVIEFTDKSIPYIETVSDCDKSLEDIFHINEEDLTNVDKLADIFYNIIFDDSIEMIEECESNE